MTFLLINSSENAGIPEILKCEFYQIVHALGDWLILWHTRGSGQNKKKNVSILYFSLLYF